MTDRSRMTFNYCWLYPQEFFIFCRESLAFFRLCTCWTDKVRQLNLNKTLKRRLVKTVIYSFWTVRTKKYHKVHERTRKDLKGPERIWKHQEGPERAKMDLKGHERPKKDLEGLDRTIMVRLVNSSLRKGLLDLNGHGRILELKRFYQKVQSTQHPIWSSEVMF